MRWPHSMTHWIAGCQEGAGRYQLEKHGPLGMIEEGIFVLSVSLLQIFVSIFFFPTLCSVCVSLSTLLCLSLCVSLCMYLSVSFSVLLSLPLCLFFCVLIFLCLSLSYASVSLYLSFQVSIYISTSSDVSFQEGSCFVWPTVSSSSQLHEVTRMCQACVV